MVLIILFILTGYSPFRNEFDKVKKNIGRPIKELQENDKLKRYKQHTGGRWYFEEPGGHKHVLNVVDDIMTGIEYTTLYLTRLDLDEAKSNIGKPIKQLQENDQLKRYKEYGNEEWYFETLNGFKYQLYVENGILTKFGNTYSTSLLHIELHKLYKNIGKPIKQLQENDKLKRYKEYAKGWWYFDDSEGYEYQLLVKNGILTKIGCASQDFSPKEISKVIKNVGKPIKQLQENDKLKRYKEYSNDWWYFEYSNGLILLLYVKDGILAGFGERIRYELLSEIGEIYKNIGKPIKLLLESDLQKGFKYNSQGRLLYKDSRGYSHPLDIVDGVLIGVGRAHSGCVWSFSNLYNKSQLKPN